MEWKHGASTIGMAAMQLPNIVAIAWWSLDESFFESFEGISDEDSVNDSASCCCRGTGKPCPKRALSLSRVSALPPDCKNTAWSRTIANHGNTFWRRLRFILVQDSETFGGTDSTHGGAVLLGSTGRGKVWFLNSGALAVCLISHGFRNKYVVTAGKMGGRGGPVLLYNLGYELKVGNNFIFKKIIFRFIFL